MASSFLLRLTVEVCILLYAVLLYYFSGGPGCQFLTNITNVAELKHAIDDFQSHSKQSVAGNLRKISEQLQDLERRATQPKCVQKECPKVEQASLVPVAGPENSQCQATTFYSLAIVGTMCHASPDTDYWGDPVAWGSTHHTPTAAECCAACAAHRDTAKRGGLQDGVKSTVCNVWVHCSNQAVCGERYMECWLKHQTLPKLPAKPAGGANIGWTAGAVYDSDEDELKPLQPMLTLKMLTSLGAIKVALLPDLAPGSVRELQRMASRLVDGHCNGCHFYRSEKDFLIQGVIVSPGFYVAVPRNPNPPQKSLMERGLVCWAGGFGGPDFFINLVDNGGFGDSHLCWGKIDDMTLVDAIVRLPLKPKKNPNDMTFIANPVLFNMTLQ